MEKGRVEFDDPSFRPLPKATNKGIRYKDHSDRELAAHFKLQASEAAKRAKAVKRQKEVDERKGQVEWLESLLACLNDGEIQDAKDIVTAAIKLIRD